MSKTRCGHILTCIMSNISFQWMEVNGNRLTCWKHDFCEKSSEGFHCDVISPWPGHDSVDFWSWSAQGIPHYIRKVSARSAQRFGGHFRKKNSCWGASSLPAPSLYVARGLTSNAGQLGKLKEFLFKYCLSDHPKTFRIMLRWATLGELCAKDSDLWHDLEPDLPTPGLT